MASLHLRGLSYAHTSATSVLSEVDLDLDRRAGTRSWIGVVGANGVGKTTLLRLLAGALSPGTRKRWQLATALAQRPDVLLLDEPTNHLDGVARELVLAALERFDGLGLVVSHDRTVLERLTDRTLRLRDGSATLHPGSYLAASARWRAEEAAAAAAHRKAARHLRRERTLLADVRRERHSAEARMHRDRRLAGHTDPDAREAGRRAAQRKAEAELGARVRQHHGRVTRAETALSAVAVDRGERIHVLGANGAGKTSLLTALLAELPRTEVAARLPQELADPRAEVARLRALDPATRGQVMGAVAALGADPDRILVTDDPSPGEARKLALAALLVSDASVLVLDEPTNHLDLPSIERLGEALTAWPGALLLVTHDDALAAATTTSRWHVHDRRVSVTTWSEP